MKPLLQGFEAGDDIEQLLYDITGQGEDGVLG